MFQLFKKNDMDTPIAVLQTPNYAKGRTSHELVLEPAAMEMLDTVIISLVLTLAEKFLMEQTFMNQATNAYEVNQKLFGRRSVLNAFEFLLIADYHGAVSHI